MELDGSSVWKRKGSASYILYGNGQYGIRRVLEYGNRRDTFVATTKKYSEERRSIITAKKHVHLHPLPSAATSKFKQNSDLVLRTYP